MHHGIAGRVFGALGDAAGRSGWSHDRIAEGAYAAARSLTRASGPRRRARVQRDRAAADAPSLEHSLRGRLAVGALNGAFGDSLQRRGNRLALPMSLRLDGRNVELDRARRWRAPTRTPRPRSRCSSTDCARPTKRGSWAPPAMSRTARGSRPSSATRRSTSATTPAGTSPRTGASSPSCSTSITAHWPVDGRRDRADRPLDGRSRRPQRVSLRQPTPVVAGAGPPRVHARLAASRRPAREGGDARDRPRLPRLPETRAASRRRSRPQLRDQGPRSRLPRRRGLA